jgi:hypothetical protein
MRAPSATPCRRIARMETNSAAFMCRRLAAALAVSLLAVAMAHPRLHAQSRAIPDLSGIWDSTGRAHPANSERVPWGKDNFPELNERGLAYQKVFDEAISPKYDCQPSTPPAIEFDPYFLEITQLKDRVIFKYEKDDQTRTAWLDGRQATVHDYGIQGLSVAHYEDNALVVVTDHFVFDITGFDDYNGIPSSPQKKITERYWRDGESLRFSVTVEDPMFLRKPASYTSRYLPGPKGYKLASFECDPETSRIMLKYLVPKYK